MNNTDTPTPDILTAIRMIANNDFLTDPTPTTQEDDNADPR